MLVEAHSRSYSWISKTKHTIDQILVLDIHVMETSDGEHYLLNYLSVMTIFHYGHTSGM